MCVCSALKSLEMGILDNRIENTYSEKNGNVYLQIDSLTVHSFLIVALFILFILHLVRKWCVGNDSRHVQSETALRALSTTGTPSA